MKLYPIVLLCAVTSIARGQKATGNVPPGEHNQEAREIWDTGFLQKRPQPPASLLRPRTPIHYKPIVGPIKEVSRFTESAVGVTVWRLRPSTTKDRDGSRLLIQDSGSDMVPERIDPAQPLHVDERIRIAIEVPRRGFLYVLDRETYRDGTFGDPFLIFPTQNINHGDNEVSPGRMIEIPPQTGTVHALRLTKSSDQHTGEDLMLIISSQPLPHIAPAEREQRLPATLVQQWDRDWSTNGVSFGLQNTQAEPWSPSEKKAGNAGSGYILTQSDPMPSTIVSVAFHGDKPLLVHFPIAIQ